MVVVLSHKGQQTTPGEELMRLRVLVGDSATKVESVSSDGIVVVVGGKADEGVTDPIEDSKLVVPVEDAPSAFKLGGEVDNTSTWGTTKQ